MSEKTAIEWCDSSANPSMGCDGCELWNGTKKSCYAGILHDRYGGHSKGYAPTFKDVTLFPGRMAETLKWKDLTGTERPEKPWLNGLPRLVFVSDMSDALSKAVPFKYLEAEIINTCRLSPHFYLWLTKRPNRMAEFGRWLLAKGVAWPRNLGAGTSVTDQRMADLRIPQLLEVPARLRFLSCEPLLGPVDLHEAYPAEAKPGQIDWVIAGGESGNDPEPCQVNWIREIVYACQSSSVPCFVKQLGRMPFSNGALVTLKDKKGGDMAEWPEDLRVREMPGFPKDTSTGIAPIADPRYDYL